MIAATAQPIAGVSANRETEIETIFPTIGAGLLGQLVGTFMGIANSVPTTPLRLLACLAMGGLMAPLALLAYFTRLLGSCYVVTNRSVYARSIIGGGKAKQAPLADVATIEITHGAGSEFLRTGNVRLENAQGNLLLEIPAVAYPERVKQIILDARAARQQSDSSLANIQRRG